MNSGPFSVTITSIGTVRNEIKQPLKKFDWREVVSEIIIDDRLTEALENLDEFSHIIILYWMHLSKGKHPLKVHPMGNTAIPLKGVLATRSPDRPNPIGESVARLLEKDGNRLMVSGLDAIDGTPVIDIKPYIPEYHLMDEARVPAWVPVSK